MPSGVPKSRRPSPNVLGVCEVQIYNLAEGLQKTYSFAIRTPSDLTVVMSYSSSVRALIRGQRAFSIRNASHVPRRRLASVASPNTDTLPLAGIRVLDMTRVLAGVNIEFQI